MSLSLISLNIERALHFDTVLPFLKERKPDVCCLQELREPDIPKILDALMVLHFAFVPMSIHPGDGNPAPTGIGIFSKYPISDKRIEYYRGDANSLRDFQMADVAKKYASENAMVLFCDIEAPGGVYTVGTTHFTWTPNGEPDDFQWKDVNAILPILEKAGEFVLTGDFNAPRGGEVFTEFAARYLDNIPPQYKTSIDLHLHRAARTKRHEIANKMVDGLFTTKGYSASDVSLLDGVSDHCAIAATLHKNA